MSRNNEIEREKEDCCGNCGWWWDSRGMSCHCQNSHLFGEHTNEYDVCGNFETINNWFDNEYDMR